MLKLNASYSKKVPAESDYSSKSYHCSVEVEIPDGVTPDQLQERIHGTFDMVRNAVEAELNGGTSASADAKPRFAPVGGGGGEATTTGSNGNQYDAEPASNKQLKYLIDLARRQDCNATELNKLVFEQFNAGDVYQLTRQQCSRLIDQFRGQQKKAA